MSRWPGQSAIRTGAAAIAAALALSMLLSLYGWLPQAQWARVLRPTPEALILVVFLALASLVRVAGPALTWSASAATTFVAVYAAAEALTRSAYRRSFDPVWDTAFVPGLLDLIGRGTVLTRPWFYVPLIALLLTGVLLLLRRLVLLIVRPAGRDRVVVLAAPALLVALASVFGIGEPLVPTIAAAIARDSSPREALTQGPPAPGLGRGGFRRLGRRDVFFFIVESYGETVFSKPEQARPLRPFYEEISRRLEDAGYASWSRFLESPVLGGWSWLADATLLSGLWVDSQAAYSSVLERGAVTIPRIFDGAGYRTLLVMPGTVNGTWERGVRFHGYQEAIYGWQFGYRGPKFSFVPVPDQLAIDFVHRRWVAPVHKPLFAQYTLVSSHAPFNRIPAYLEDWDRVGDGSVYNHVKNLEFPNGWLHGEAYDEGYVASVRYVLTVLTNYLVRFLPDDALIVVVGDHQPKFPISARDAPLTVPMHILSRDHRLLAPLAGSGFVPGLVPREEAEPARTSTFYRTFLNLIDGPEPARGGGS